MPLGPAVRALVWRSVVGPPDEANDKVERVWAAAVARASSPCLAEYHAQDASDRESHGQDGRATDTRAIARSGSATGTGNLTAKMAVPRIAASCAYSAWAKAKDWRFAKHGSQEGRFSKDSQNR